MATLSTTLPTLLDRAKMTDPNGKISPKMIEIIAQSNNVLPDMQWKEGNTTTGERGQMLAGIPAPTWRKINGGVQPSKGQWTQITAACGMLEAYSEADKKLADIGGQTIAFRKKIDRAHAIGMAEEFIDTLFKGNETTEPEAFTGFFPYYNSTTAASGENVIKSGTTPDRSIMIVGWGENGWYGITPQGFKTGLQQTDLGEVTDSNIDGSSGRAQIYRTHFSWDCGLFIADWRQNVRIQIDQSELTKGGAIGVATGPDLIDLITQGIELLPPGSDTVKRIYVNRTIKSFLRRQIANKVATSTLTMETVAGRSVMVFDDIEVHRVDALAAAETEIS